MGRKTEMNKVLFNELKRLVFVGLIPIIFCLLSIFISKIFLSDDVESASKFMMILSGTGVLLAIWLVVKRILYWFNIIKTIKGKK